MIGHLIPEGVHELMLAEVVNRQFHGGNHSGSLGSGTHSPPQPTHSLEGVYLLEATDQSQMCSSLAMNLHAHLQHIRGIRYRAGHCACYHGARHVAPNILPTSFSINQEPVLREDLLQIVVRPELDCAVGRLSQNCRPNPGIEGKMKIIPY